MAIVVVAGVSSRISKWQGKYLLIIWIDIFNNKVASFYSKCFEEFNVPKVIFNLNPISSKVSSE